MPYELQGPGDVDIDYSCDFSDYVEDGSPTDSIDTFSWSIFPENDGSPSTSLHTQIENQGNVTTFVTNLEAGILYKLTCHIITVQGRTDERSITILCENR